MANTTIVYSVRIDGVLTDPTSIVFRDSGGTYGVKRQDTDASVVAIDTALTKLSTGRYSYTFTDPAANLTYDYGIQFVYDGETHTEEGTIQGGVTLSDNLYDLIPRITPWVPAVTDAVLKQILRRTARDFARDTWAVKEKINITTVEDQKEYELYSTYDAQIMRVMSIKDEDRNLDFMMGDNPYTIEFYGEPEGGDTYVATCALLPDEDATGIPQDVINEWGDGIVAGTIYQLLRMDGYPWTNHINAELYKKRYWKQCADAKRAEASGRLSDRQSYWGFNCDR